LRQRGDGGVLEERLQPVRGKANGSHNVR
jgi:hypothetical protein